LKPNLHMSRLGNKVAIITGGGRGIGRAVALAFASEGAKLVITSRTDSELQNVANEIRASWNGEVLAFQGDVTRSADVEMIVASTISNFQRIDILVNNAGIPGPAKPLIEISEKEWDETINVNLKGMFLFTRAVLPNLLSQKSGNIINVSSGAGQKRARTSVRSIAYGVSKFGVEGFTHLLAVSIRNSGVNVNALIPGVIRTKFHESTSSEQLRQITASPGHEMHEPEFVNDAVVYLASLSPGQLTGETLNVAEWNEKHVKGGVQAV
jgi:3-oxoacyl-[acyl-carrier protein] reductase